MTVAIHCQPSTVGNEYSYTTRYRVLVSGGSRGRSQGATDPPFQSIAMWL